MTRRFIPYRRDLKRPSQSLRRDPSPAERKLWYEFLRALPTKFTRQKPLGHYVVDFYCASERLAIEVDGDSHFSDRAQEYDERRTMQIQAVGVKVVRFSKAEVMHDFEGVCAAILRIIAKP